MPNSSVQDKIAKIYLSLLNSTCLTKRAKGQICAFLYFSLHYVRPTLSLFLGISFFSALFSFTLSPTLPLLVFGTPWLENKILR